MGEWKNRRGDVGATLRPRPYREMIRIRTQAADRDPAHRMRPPMRTVTTLTPDHAETSSVSLCGISCQIPSWFLPDDFA